MKGRHWAIVLVSALAVTVGGLAYVKHDELGASLGENWRVVLTAVLIALLAGVLLVIAAFLVKKTLVAALATVGGLVVGVVVVYGLAILSPSLLPFIEQRERVAARSLVGVVGNGSIAFVSAPNGNVDIYTVDPEGADTPTRLTTDPDDDTEPAWSPDGARLAFARFGENDADIYTIKADGSDEKRLTTDPGADTEPAWSPDGERIAFTSGRTGDAEIYVMNADGTGAKNLTMRSATDREAAWSPDGERIAFTTFRGGDAEIWVMNADGSNPKPLTTAPVHDTEPNWGPDGAHLAFVSARHGDAEVYRYREVRGKPSVEPVTKNTTEDSWPAWSPDGGDLAFIRVDDVGKATLHVETDPKRKGEQSRLVTRLPVREARLSWQPIPRQGLELPEEGELAFRYAPLVYLHPGEARFPMDAGDFVRRSRLACQGLREVEPSNLVATVKESCGGRGGILNLEPGFEWGSRRTVGGLYTDVPVFWERVKKPAAITYWFFYASSKTAGAVGVHEGDWEGISICLGAEDRPTRVAYNQHKGVERRPWPWAPRFGTHPIVYAALGSHASYPENLGRRKKTQDLTDEGPIWPTWRPLREVAEEEWYEFRGKWGAQGDSPTGPSPRRRGGKGCG